jgi:hypothetical protein
MKVENLFEAIRTNADAEAYRVAREVLDSKHAWLEQGIAEVPGVPPATQGRQHAAAGN